MPRRRTFLGGLVLLLATLQLARIAAATGGHDPVGSYTSDIYHPFVLATAAFDPRLTVHTQQVCTPDGMALILHTLTATDINQPYRIDLRFTDTYREVGIIQGSAHLEGSLLTWLPTSSDASVVVSMSTGPCLHLFPIVFLVPAVDQTIWLPLALKGL